MLAVLLVDQLLSRWLTVIVFTARLHHHLPRHPSLHAAVQCQLQDRHQARTLAAPARAATRRREMRLQRMVMVTTWSYASSLHSLQK